MAQINKTRLVDNISKKIGVYQPLVEAIVNAIQAIDESKRKDGEIIVTLKRDPQAELGIVSETIPAISGIEICDNGIGFINKHRDSFDTLYTGLKYEQGGKGFGRFIFLKFFKTVKVESFYLEESKYYQRNFDFFAGGNNKNIIDSENIEELKESIENKTIVSLNTMKKDAAEKFDKQLETIARKLLEKLLIYFIDDQYECPKIILKEENTKKEIILNDYLKKHKEINEIKNEKFTLKNDTESEDFIVKVFKIFYSKSQNSIRLIAHRREVIEEPLHNYVPEFHDDFYDEVKGADGKKVDKNYVIKAYVLGKYLDSNVSLERCAFNFPKEKDSLYPFSQREIESKAAEVAKKIFEVEVNKRQDKKISKIKKYVDSQAPWHKLYVEDLDLSQVPFKVSDDDLEAFLLKAKFEKELTTKKEIEQVLNDEQTELKSKIEDLITKITAFGQSELVHYVSLRRVVLDLFKKALKLNKSGKYDLEKGVHDIVFPTRSDSQDTSYQSHNLWIIDERLSFHEYLASDKPLNTKDGRPDILIFDNKILVRGAEEPSNPIVVFEFKKPQRESYGEDDDPIKQIKKYVEKIRSGSFKNPEGRDIKVDENTPAYGFLICDITSKIEEFCQDHSLTKSPDNEGYFGYHPGYKMYIEVISFDKLVGNAELRNRILFKKLGLM